MAKFNYTKGSVVYCFFRTILKVAQFQNRLNSSCKEEIATEHEEICKLHQSFTGFSLQASCMNGCFPEDMDI